MRKLEKPSESLVSIISPILGHNKTWSLGQRVLVDKDDEFSVGLHVRAQINPEKKVKNSGTITKIETNGNLCITFFNQEKRTFPRDQVEFNKEEGCITEINDDGTYTIKISKGGGIKKCLAEKISLVPKHVDDDTLLKVIIAIRKLNPFTEPHEIVLACLSHNVQVQIKKIVSLIKGSKEIESYLCKVEEKKLIALIKEMRKWNNEILPKDIVQLCPLFGFLSSKKEITGLWTKLYGEEEANNKRNNYLKQAMEDFKNSLGREPIPNETKLLIQILKEEEKKKKKSHQWW